MLSLPHLTTLVQGEGCRGAEHLGTTQAHHMRLCSGCVVHVGGEQQQDVQIPRCLVVTAVPVTTGDMLKGRSSMAMTKVFPQNSFLVIWMAATIPQTVLMGTETNARSNVIFTCRARPTCIRLHARCLVCPVRIPAATLRAVMPRPCFTSVASCQGIRVVTFTAWA